MRLQFSLNKVKIDPVCHIQLLRHAEEFQGRNNIYGQLYGALYDDEAEITGILPFPDGELSTKEELDGIERRHDELLSTYNLDNQKVGWYLVCYKRNFWDNLETIKHYENYIDTSFFLIFDDKQRQLGCNPYKAYRLKDSFALQEHFRWEDLQKCNLDTDNPLEEIPVEVRKNQIFESLMLFNKDPFLKQAEAARTKQTLKPLEIKQNLDEYIEAFDERQEIQQNFNETYLRSGENKAGKEKIIPFGQYSKYLGQALKLQNYERYFKQYQKDFDKYTAFFEPEH